MKKRVLIQLSIILLVVTSGVQLRKRGKGDRNRDKNKPRPVRTLPPILPEEYRQNLLKYSKVQGFTDGSYECKGGPHTGAFNIKDRCCSCDDLCHKRNDCCYDVEYVVESTVQPPQYNNIMATKAEQFRHWGCLPVVARDHIDKNHTVEYVIGVHKCPDDSSCMTPGGNETLQLVKGVTDKIFYVNEQCAQCNGQNFTYPEIEISQCINEEYIRYLDRNQTDFDLEAQLYERCYFKLADQSKNTCPFGRLTDPYVRDETQCSSKQLAAQTCAIYFAAVRDSTGKIHANPTCMSCETTDKPSKVDCRALRHQHDVTPTANPAQPLDIKLLVRGHSPDARVRINDRKLRTMTLCEDGYLQADSMRCFRYPPGAVAKNPHDNESIMVAVSHRLVQIQQIVAPVMILTSLVALSWTLITFFYFQELKHTPGKIMFLLTCVLYMYYVVHLKLLLKHFSWGIAQNMQILLRWCAICKYIMVAFLCYHLRQFQHYYIKPRSIQLFHLIVQSTGIVTLATIILIIGQSNHAFHLESLLGRLVFYQLTNTISAGISVGFLLSALKQARVMKETMKQYEHICVFLITTYEQCLRFIVLVWVTDSFYTVLLDSTTSEAALFVNTCCEFVFLLTNSTHGVLVVKFLVVNSRVLDMYRKGW